MLPSRVTQVKSGTDTEFPGKASFVVEGTRLASGAAAKRIAQAHASAKCRIPAGIDSAIAGIWRAPGRLGNSSVTGPEMKQLRQDLGEAIGRPLSAADMAKLCGLEGDDGAD